ncbi:hypothetical protein NCCP691_22030 [Noviherbaspirillum aridicola]|uniref:Transmembrane protein n=2 Tax=Noviherbaspirillum aridicola TaxID=2849687 RepID=A0ABQ4Q650_9BURK|nr:hypothetical protein NCCP691_22030 [Noviherbaspirillum aridicola]
MLAAAAAGLLLIACSPTYDWREIRGEGAGYRVMLPAKPASHTRAVNLNGTQVQMTMTGAETDGVSFTVATAQLADAAQAQQALQAMKQAMLRNVGGSVKQDKPVEVNGASNASELTATGGADASGRPRLMVARFFMRDNQVFQMVVLGRENGVPQEAVDTFLSSFRPA